MRKKGSILIAMGLLLIAAALSLTLYNVWDGNRAGQAAQSTVQSLRELIPQKGEGRTLGETASGQATAPGQEPKPAEVPAPVEVTTPGEVTTPIEGTTHVEMTTPVEVTIPGGVTAPAEVTTPGAVTTPVEGTIPGGVTAPVEVTAPREATTPEEAATHGVKIKPGAQTAPDLKKGILAAKLLGEREMPTVTLNGYRYIGMLDVQSLDLSLPVMEEWDYDRLKVSPCRFAGNVYEDNLVICAHNYPQHFTPLKYAPLGTEVKFTDAEGNKFLYAISSVETVGPNDVEGMIHGDWDLTLFTCNTNGQTRCAIRCDRIK